MGGILTGSENAIMNEKQLLERTIDLIKAEISRQTAMKISDLRDKEPFGHYGMDSVVVMEITKRLEEKIGHLSKTLFFEFDSIEEMAFHLMQIKREELSRLFGLEDTGEARGSQEEKKQSCASKVILKNEIRKKSISVTGKSIILQQQGYVSHEEDDIAIIGIAGRYPMADNLEEFWENLKNGRDCITEIPENRWDYSIYYDADRKLPGKSYGKWGGFLKDVDKFDPLFFHMTPLEADFTDPQERLFLEETYHAIEDAGYSKVSVDNTRTGVFVGVMYGLYQLIENKEHDVRVTGRNNFASIANRVSYFFNFHGPSIALDTMCSSSLTALYLACNSIRNKDIDMAVVGGVNLSLHPNKYVQLSQGGFLSSDGRCRSFGADGDGYVPGEGVGSMLIKPVKKAIEDGDHIYSVIKGIGINAGGRTQGYTVPNPNAQCELIQEVLEKSKVHPATISYVEAHGTGTALGDPIEINAITKAYRKYTEEKQFCSIGSVKSNIGHTESAAGMASITKVVLQMKYRQLAPSIHSDILNPYIDFAETSFKVQHGLEEWKPLQHMGAEGTGIMPRRAAISAFGAGGANAHLILEEYVPEHKAPQEDERRQRLFLLSARDRIRLKQSAQNLLDFLDQGKEREEEGTVSAVSRDMFLKCVCDSVEEVSKLGEGNIRSWMSLCEFGFGEYEMEEIAARLQDKCEAGITAEMLTAYPTLEALSNYLYEQANATQIKQTKKDFVSLDDLEYTLQIGREQMQERLAVIAQDKEGLAEALVQYLRGEADGKFIREGAASAQPNYNAASELPQTEGKGRNQHPDLISQQQERLVAAWDIDKISELWVMGADFDFRLHYKRKKRKRISLPTYPFEKLRCWVTSETEGNTPAKIAIGKHAGEISKEEVRDYATGFLMDVFMRVLKIPKESLSANADFENYGLDSIYVKHINQYLESIFGTLPATLLFTYKNIKTLAGYFASNHSNILIAMMTGSPEDVQKQEKAEFIAESLPEARGERAGNIVACDEIAVIGMSGRMPQSADLEVFFEQLKEGKDFITEIPKERWDYKKYPEIKGHYGAFLKDIDKFDPQFFNISPMAAKFMDPQERIMIESVWSCLEDAGYTPKAMENQDDEEDTRGNVSVYIGTTFNEYGLYGAQDHERGIDLPLNAQIYSVANRISYLFNFGGPSLTVDTACSSSLYAVHLACESIRSGECGMAVAGGVNLSLHPSKYVTLSWGGFLAEDGHCRTFGAGGTGYVPGEGCAAILLKPLKQAEADGDNIYAIIKGSAVNHGGKTYGYSVPNPTAQAKVIKKALKNSGIDPRTISYVEAHGTGTSLGDPIEIQALTEAYRCYTDDKQYCAVGSVKSNIGHLEAAAGISQVVKVILQMKHKLLVPSRLNSEKINENLHFEDTPFYVQSDVQPWNRPVIGSQELECKRRAGISAFGVGGVNVHLIVEEYEEEQLPRENVAGDILIPISAKTEENLKKYIGRYIDWIDAAKKKGDPLPELYDMSFTLITGRIQLPYRACFAVKGYEELKASMQQFLEHGAGEKIVSGIAYENKDYVKPPRGEEPAQAALKWVNGEMSLEDFEPQPQGRRVTLPGYPFAKETYWMYSRKQGFEGEPGVKQKTKESQDTILERLDQAYESERLQLIIEEIQSIFADLLGFTEGRLPDVNEGYFSLGLESAATREAYMILEERFHIELDDQVFFNYPSICKTAEYVMSRMDFDHLSQEPSHEEQDVVSLVLSKKEYVRKDAETGKAKGNEKILCICSEQYRKFMSDGVFAPKAAVRYAKDFIKAKDSLRNEWVPDRIEIIDGNIKANTIISLFAFIQELQEKMRGNVAVEYYFINRPGDYLAARQGAVGRFLSTLQMEDVRFVCKEIAVSPKLRGARIKEVIKKEYRTQEYGRTVFYSEQGRHVQILRKLDGISGESRFRKGGAYLITGGLGGVGKIIAQHLCSKYGANLILCGRKPEADVQDVVRAIHPAKGSVVYMQADITKKDEVTELAARIKQTCGHLHGVIHCAGVIRDARIMNKTSDEFMEVVRPKVDGALYLDEALKEEKLDFFLLCSSVAAVIGNIGQADYCYANSFLDEFARARNQKVKNKGRYGHTVSISWPFWKNGGMKVDKYSQKWMNHKFGLMMMENEIGISVVELSAKTEEDAFHAMVGEAEKIISSFAIYSDTDDEPGIHEEKREESIEAEVEGLDFDELVTQLEKEIME